MQKQNNKIVKGKVRKLVFRNFFRAILFMLDSVFMVLGLRSSKKFWGIVYDSKTKQPLDPAVVKLISAGSYLDVQTCLTDMAGRYGFLVDPGKYKIVASKTNYTFPSKIVNGNSDGMFEDIYFGDFFEVLQDSAVVAPNIPMDPVMVDWNQEAKLKYTHTYPRLRHFARLCIAAIFWLGLIASVIVSANNYFPANYKISVLNLNFILYCYLFLILLNWLVPKIRLWGQLVGEKRQSLGNIVIEVSSIAWADSVLAKTVTTFEGKFFLRLSPGKYALSFKRIGSAGKVEMLGQIKLKVGRKGLVNETFYVDL